MQPEEFNYKLSNISIGAIIYIALISFSFGAIYTKVVDTDKKIDLEINGLREDWERDRVEQDKKIEKLNKVIFKAE